MSILISMILAATIQVAPRDKSNQAVMTKCFSEHSVVYQGEVQNITYYTIEDDKKQSFYTFEDVKTKKQHIIFGSCIQTAQGASGDEEDFFAPNN